MESEKDFSGLSWSGRQQGVAGPDELDAYRIVRILEAAAVHVAERLAYVCPAVPHECRCNCEAYPGALPLQVCEPRDQPRFVVFPPRAQQQVEMLVEWPGRQCRNLPDQLIENVRSTGTEMPQPGPERQIMAGARCTDLPAAPVELVHDVFRRSHVRQLLGHAHDQRLMFLVRSFNKVADSRGSCLLKLLRAEARLVDGSCSLGRLELVERRDRLAAVRQVSDPGAVQQELGEIVLSSVIERCDERQCRMAQGKRYCVLRVRPDLLPDEAAHDRATGGRGGITEDREGSEVVIFPSQHLFAGHRPAELPTRPVERLAEETNSSARATHIGSACLAA